MKTSSVFPEEFITRMQCLLGENAWIKFVTAYSVALKRSLRINTSVIPKQAFLERVEKYGWNLSPIAWEDNGFFIDREDHSIPLGKTIEHFLGLFYIQEASSMAPARALELRDDAIVLDMSSAPGSKTTQMSSLLHNTGLVVANDVSTQRTKATVTNIERQGCANVGITTLDARVFVSLTPNTFDHVLLDAPCSGEGTFTKADAFFTRWNDYAIRRMAGLQKTLIDAAFRALKPGATMVYSTCTFAPEENEEVLDFLLKTFPGNASIEVLDDRFIGVDAVGSWEGMSFDPSVARGRRFLPHVSGTGGFFVAKIAKKDSTPCEVPIKNPGRSKEIFLSKKEDAHVRAFLAETYGLDEDALQGRVITRIDDDLWIKPEQYVELSQRLRFDRCGVQAVTVEHGDRYRLTTMAARAFGKSITRNTVVLLSQQQTLIAEGRDVELSPEQAQALSVPHAVLTDEEGFVLGVGLVRDRHVKNQIPRAML